MPARVGALLLFARAFGDGRIVEAPAAVGFFPLSAEAEVLPLGKRFLALFECIGTLPRGSAGTDPTFIIVSGASPPPYKNTCNAGGVWM